MILPHRLGPYLVLEEIGRGGMAIVSLARHVDTGELVALKVPRCDKASLASSLRAEIQTILRLRHPGIIEIRDVGLSDPVPWYAMELLQGRTFHRYHEDIWSAVSRSEAAALALGSTPPTIGEDDDASKAETIDTGDDWELPSRPGAAFVVPAVPVAAAGHLDEVLHLALLVCSPLAHLHARGIVHRDLSPKNLFRRNDGTVVITDFGLAARAGFVVGPEVVGHQGPAGGVPAYMSPEQILQDPVDPRSDLYSFACVLYEMITNHAPFVSKDPAEVKTGHLRRVPRPLSELVRGVPPALDKLVLAMLEKDPRDRPGYAEDVDAALRAILGVSPVARREHYLYRPKIAGREAQLRQVFDGIEGRPEWRGWFGLVHGESGSGKTRFATAVANHARERRLRVVTGECVGGAALDGQRLSNAGPLHPLRPLLAAIGDHCREHGRETTGRILDGRTKILAKYEPALLHLPGQSELPEPAALPPHAAERRLIGALRDAVCAFADEVRLVLVLDDLQWADELTCELIMGLSEEVFRRHRLVLLGTYRTGEARGVLGQIAERPWVCHAHTGPLGKEAVGQIASAMLAARSLPEPHVEVLAERSQGNPFFVAECLRTLVAEGHLRRREWQWEWHLGDVALGALLPQRLEDLVRRRLRVLSPGARDLLAIAAVLGREAETEVLTAIWGAGGAATAAGVSELAGAQILHETPGDRVRFIHDKVREVAYEEVAPGRRRALHSAAAKVLRARSARGRHAPPHDAIAEHLLRGDELEGARDALEAAASESLDAFAAADAIKSLQRALAIDDQLDARTGDAVEPRRRARWLRQVARAYVDTGRSEESMRWVSEGLKLLGWPLHRSKLRLAGGILAQSARLFGRLARGPSRSISPQKREDFLEVATAAELLVPIFTYTTGKRLELFYAVVSHLYLAETVATSREKAWAYINAHVILGLLPFSPAVEVCRRRAHEALADVPEPAVKSWIHLLTCVGATGRADWGSAFSHGEGCAALAGEIDFRRRWEEAHGMLCTAHLLHGDFEKAMETSQQRFAAAAVRGDVQTQLWALLGQAQAELNLGKTDRVLNQAEWIQKQLARLNGRNERIFAHAVLAEAWLREGDVRRALAAAREGAAAVREGWPPVVYCVNAYSLLANVLLELSVSPSEALESERARLRVEASLMCGEVFFSAVIYPVHRARSLLVGGRLAEIWDLPLAPALHAESLVMARKYDLRFDEGLAELALARLLPPGDAVRRGRLHRARSLFSGLRAAHELGRVDAEAARDSALPPS